MKKKQKRLVRILAIVLACLMAGGAIVSAIVSIASAEEAPPAERNRFDFTIEYLEEEQALRVSQRLVYLNDGEERLDRVLFYAPANLYRRQSALAYEADEWAARFPDGYVPGGIELERVRVDDLDADWGFQGENEMYLRVACDLQSGERCEFSFDYYLLLTGNNGFLGVGDTDCRLSDFYFAPARREDGDFVLNAPLTFTRYIDTPAADFQAEITLPDTQLLACGGAERSQSAENHRRVWTLSAENARDFSIIFGRRYREQTRQSASGVALRCLTNVRGGEARLLDAAQRIVDQLEEWFGAFPLRQIDFVQSDYATEPLNHSGCVWLPESLIREGGDALDFALGRALSQQYFGLTAYARPASDAWLSDSVCEFLSYRLIEAAQGREAYLAALNAGVLDALQLTLPGGLSINSDAQLLSAYEYDILLRDRGAAVFHELRTAMGDQALLDGLRRFYEKGLSGVTLGEMDLVDALDAASGASWEAFLTDWVFNVGDYANQTLDYLD